MQNVKMDRKALLTRIKANRENHYDLFRKAQEGYRKQAIKELDAMLEEAREGKPIRRAVHLIEPQNHAGDYDQVIDMLECSVEETVTLSAQEFKCYVRDNWEWSEFANSTNSTYAVMR